MKPGFIFVILTATALLVSSSPSWALENQANAPQEAASKTKANPREAIDARRKAAARIKPIDINNATSGELKKLPGISDAEAARIIAGRPYASKAWLVTNSIIDRGIYENLKHLIIAKQPYKDAAKNAAIYSKKK